MARKRVELCEAHRRRVAAGLCSLAELAAELGITRQVLHRRFKRLGWSTRPETDVEPGKAPKNAPERPGPAQKEEPTPAIARSSASLALATVSEATVEDLAELARQEIASSALLAMAQARELLSTARLSPQGLKATVAALATAADQLARAGYTLGPEAGVVPRLVIEEYGPLELAEIRANAEHEFMGSFCDADDDGLPEEAELAEAEEAEPDEPASPVPADPPASPRPAPLPAQPSVRPVVIDPARLRERLRDVARRYGARTLRVWAAALNLPTPREAADLVSVLTAAASRDAVKGGLLMKRLPELAASH